MDKAFWDGLGRWLDDASEAEILALREKNKGRNREMSWLAYWENL